MDDFFSDSKPDLINKKVLKGFEKMIYKAKSSPAYTYPNINIGGGGTGMEEIGFADRLFYFYDIYVKPNTFGLIVLVILALYLLFRYWTKGETEKYHKSYYSEKIPVKKQKSYSNHLQNKKKQTDKIVNIDVPVGLKDPEDPEVLDMLDDFVDPYYEFDPFVNN